MNGLENISRKSETDHTIIQTEAGQIIPQKKKPGSRSGRAREGLRAA